MKILIALIVAACSWFVWRSLSLRRRAASPPPDEGVTPGPPLEAPPTATAYTDPVQAIASELGDFYEASGCPQDLETQPAFLNGVAMLADPSTPLDQVVRHCIGGNGVLAAMAAAALARRPDAPPAADRVIAQIGNLRMWTIHYVLRYLQTLGDRAVVGEVLLQAQTWWPENVFMPQTFSDFVDAREAAGEILALDGALARREPEDLDALRDFLGKITTPHARTLRDQFDTWERSRLDPEYLNGVGRLWTPGETREPVVVHEAWASSLDSITRAFDDPGPCGVLLVGESGVGKTALFRAMAERLENRGWRIFEASAMDVVAGQSYLGELEQRMRELLGRLDAGRRVVWVIPNMHELVFAGQHRYSPTGVLDMLLPAVESGRLRVVGELQPAALERMLQQRPRMRTSFRSVRIDALPPAAARQLALSVIGPEYETDGIAIDPVALDEAVDLARHYFGSRALPGSLFDLLRQTRMRMRNLRATRLSRDDLFDTLTTLTGLPRSVLDDREGLDGASVRAFFDARVMGQPEAVQTLIDRVAMLKAGLTDPLRPIGVFLFAGPTGTGKTEVAKTLAEYLFGSQDRMIRLDMSEFQESASLPRILGNADGAVETDALVNRIRKHPFSVVLLDEFEKAHPRVWDLFLQVFDDGRLTDSQGALADFRHSIIILTTNLGATAHQGSSLGFTEADSPFSEAQVTRAIAQAFRPEFVNRLDRVVVFRPLSRAVMRDILKKELRNVLRRRGFRSRDWAVEWEESAVDFLLAKGFTSDLGARPLRRAIDQYILAPIAMTIVENRFPEGDQFLFVRSDGADIQVTFVDPDVSTEIGGAPDDDTALATGALFTLPSLVCTARGSQAERQFVSAELERLMTRLDGVAWAEQKMELLSQLNTPGFWQDDGRFAIIDAMERMDRIQAGAETARSLMRRLEQRVQTNGTAPAPLVQNVAEQLFLLHAALTDLDAKRASDVYLLIEHVAGAPDVDAAASVWTRTIADMYLRWAKRRRMQATVLRDLAGTPIVISVAGFGAHHILGPEAGLHVLEVPDGYGSYDRHTARVRVAPQPEFPRPVHRAELDHALACLVSASSTVARRYREKPSPLVRDSVRGWRTGRLSAVLEGGFDCVG